MTDQLLSLLPPDFAPTSRIWIFQCNRPFAETEEMEINEQLQQFYMQWKSHGAPVKGWAKLIFKQFIVVMADENEQDEACRACSRPGSTAGRVG